MRLSVLVPLSLLALGSIAMACSSNPEPTTPDPSGCAPGQYCPPAPVASVTTAPTTTAPATPPSSSATPIAATMATPVLTSTAGDKVQGMKPEGGAFAGQFQEGQTLEQPLNLTPGKCYAVVAAGLPGVTEIDVQIVAQPLPPMPAVVLAQDNSTGPVAILGGRENNKDNCFKHAAPIPVAGKVILKVSKGGGIAGGQIYLK